MDKKLKLQIKIEVHSQSTQGASIVFLQSSIFFIDSKPFCILCFIQHCIQSWMQDCTTVCRKYLIRGKKWFYCRFSVETQSQTASELGMNWAGEVVAQALLAQMRGMELPSHPSLSSARGFGPAYEL